MMMALKQFNAKHAERWLQKLKNQNAQSYKELIKFLRKYEKCQDEYECYLKMSHTLLPHADLTRQLNGFLQEGNKFIITRPDDEKLRDFMSYVKKNRPAVFEKIISMIQELNKSKGEGNHDVSKMILPKLKQIIEGDQELERLIQEAIDMKDEELIRRKNLQHLKVNRPPPMLIPEDPKDTHLSQSYVPRQRRPYIEPKIEVLPQKKDRKNIVTVVAGNFTNTNQERLAISQMEKSIDHKKYKYIIKVFKIYYLNIITRKQAISLINSVGLEEVHFDNVKQILQTRQFDRRKQSWFKPLGDINFGNAERISPSYVSMPFFYPVKCSGKTPQIKAITNEKWISVPYGSQQNENFSVRNKNMNEINLLKAEDQRYQFDLYFKKMQKTKELIDCYLDQDNNLNEIKRHKLLKLALSMGVIQLIYKNCKEDQKEQLENFLKNYPRQTCTMFKNKLDTELVELKNVRDVHAIKVWNEIANKNYFKALDLKGFEFKKNEKLKMKNQYFITELNERNKILGNGGDVKATTLSFEDKKDFFSILNSFECSSRMQKCNSRTLPNYETFDLKDENRRPYYPIMIMAFEDQQICDQVYCFLIYYIENSPMTEGEKIKHKMFLEQFLTHYLKWRHPIRKYPTENFQQEQLLLKINNPQINYRPEEFIGQDSHPLVFRNYDKKTDDDKNKKGMNVMQDEQSRYSYLPERNQKKQVLYGSEHIYTLTRFLYAVYERMIKMREVSEGTENLKLFELLFYTSIKVKESIKFEQTLNALFGKSAYLFSTIYKLFDGLLKALVMSSSCILVNASFKLMEQHLCEDHQLLLINRFCLMNNLTTNKILRLTFNQEEKVLYINYFDSYYKTDDLGKDMNKKRIQLSKGVEIYTTEFYRGNNTIRKPVQFFQNNKMEYLFQSNTFKLQNHTENQDVMVATNRPEEALENYMREMKRVHRLNSVTR